MGKRKLTPAQRLLADPDTRVTLAPGYQIGGRPPCGKRKTGTGRCVLPARHKGSKHRDRSGRQFTIGGRS